MNILPVLDLMQGQIVRGIAGRREEYRPIVSKLVASAEPRAVALALREQFGFGEFYLADLDAIRGRLPDLETYQQLQDAGMRLWIDAGLRTHKDRTLKMLIVANVAGIVVGLESIETPEELRRILARVGADRVIFSLDLHAGRPLGHAEAWQTDDPFTIADRAIRQMGVRRMIVLDLVRVGVGLGIGTEELCARLKRAFPEVELIAGGGVTSAEEVRRIGASGVDRVLIASALHDGRITRADSFQLADTPPD
jgi:phosphoribosylformimino-5-aminoimidazole carboxamide ribotide isomerase